MLRAIVRAVSPAMNQCELTYLERREIDIARAVEQHGNYVRMLRDAGLSVYELPADPRYPDSVFVEDPAVVVDEVAVIARMGAESRRGEAQAMSEALGRFRPLVKMTAPATLDGGDVLQMDHTLFVGLSQRTNRAGIEQLREAVAPWGYDVRAVQVRGCLHLKSGACRVGGDTLLVNREWVNTSAFQGYDLVAVEEPWAADVLALGNFVLMPEGYPKTRELLERAGFAVNTIDVSELQKAEAGVTCMSVIFRTQQ